MKKIIPFLLLLLVTSFGIGSIAIPQVSSSQVKPTSSVQKGISRPIELSISALKIKTPIEWVGRDIDGRMDVPKNYLYSGWWMYGPTPGEEGSAVIAGHIDTPTGERGVFYHLNTIKIGDKVEIKNEQNEIYTFTVIDKQLFKDSVFPINEVFSKKGGKYLNLITCAGIFNTTEQNYEERLVIYTQLLE